MPFLYPSFTKSYDGNNLFADELLDVGSHGLAEDLAGTQMSLALLSLVAEVVAVIGMEHLHLAGSRNGEPFRGRLMRFDLAHDILPFG